MINTKIPLENFLQNYRFRIVKNHIHGDVLDFGGNEGELKELVSGSYTLVNYNHSAMEGKEFDTIVMLAVLEHIPLLNINEIFKKFKKTLKKDGKLFLTTPTKIAKPVLESLVLIGLLEKHNIEEHEHYWSYKDIENLALDNGFKITKYKKFQFGFNQYAVLMHNH